MDVNDIGAGLAILGTAEVSKDAIQRILAPTADYVGAGVLQGTKASVNMARVLVAAARRAGPKLHEPGEVPPRVLKNVIDQAPWIDDELMAEYMGGIVASSFGPNPRDDRAVALQATLNRVSTYALRTHYICYREYYLAFRDCARWEPVYDNLKNLALANDSMMYAPHRAFCYAMGLTSSEQADYMTREDYFAIYGHSTMALGREELLAPGAMGDRLFLSRTLSGDASYEAPDDGFVYGPTPPGEELLMWAVGRGDLDSPLVPTSEGERAWQPDLALFDDVPLQIPGVPMVNGFAPLEQLKVEGGL